MASTAPTPAQTLKKYHPHLKLPIVVSAPLRPFTLSPLATAVSQAGGLGFISSTSNDAEELASARHILSPDSPPLDALPPVVEVASSPPEPLPKDLISILKPLYKSPLPAAPTPVGIGYQIYFTPLATALRDVHHYLPAAVWLFAWKSIEQLNLWARAILAATSYRTKVYIQVGTVRAALDAVRACYASNQPGVEGSLYPVSTETLVLVAQGSDAGGHQLEHGASLLTLLPEMRSALAEAGFGQVPILAAGGIADAQGAAAALTLGAAGVVLGTRLVCSKEISVPEGFRRFVLKAEDGGVSTVTTRLFDRLRGTGDFPNGWYGRALVNKSWREVEAGVPEKEVAKEYESMVKKQESGLPDGDEEAYGENGILVAYASTGVGLIKEVKGAAEIVDEIRSGVSGVLSSALESVK